MLGRYVPPKRTLLDFDAAAQAMSSALAAVLGEQPSRPTLALALGKTALETGRFSSCWNGNWGNIKASEKYEGMYTCIVLNEVIGGKVQWFAPEGRLTGNPAKGGVLAGDPADAGRSVPPGHPQTRMRAFPTPSDGALDYVRFVAGGRYAEAWKLLLQGDARGYVHALKTAGYFTAPEEDYAKGVLSLQKEFIAKLERSAPPPEVPVPPVEVVREWLSEQDSALLEAALADRTFDIVDENRRAAHRELSGNDEPDSSSNDGVGSA